MDGKQLKNSILQWAIQGKLVPQNPKDEPASKLLERIAASRNESSLSLPKGTSLRGPCKATKQSKNQPSRIYRENGMWYEQVGTATPKDISEDIPFEIPENWAWCRLKDLASFLNGDRSKNYPNKSEYVSNGVPWINTGHITPAGYLSAETMNYISEEKFNSLGGGFIASGDLVYCLRGATYGKIARVEPYDRGAIASSLMIIRPVVTDVREYIFLLLRTPYAKQQLNIYANGAAQPNLAAKDIEKYFIPLPPLAEQKRIVAKLEKVLPLADEYGAAQEQLDKLNKELPEALKKSILQQAIQGKLVPQNPKDEPAQKLLEKIALSRHSEHSEESSKGSKKTSKDQSSRIYRENGVWYEQIGTATPKDISDEIPFEIPETWAWCRLGNCSDYAASKEKAKSFDDIQEMWSLDLEDIEKNSGRIVKRLKVSERKIVGEKVVFKKGQVLYSKLRPYLKKILVAPEDGVCSSEIVPFSPFECLDASYLVTVLKSPHVDYTINLVTYGVKMPRVGTDTMLNLLIPIPPLAEQKRIVAKLEQLFKVL